MERELLIDEQTEAEILQEKDLLFELEVEANIILGGYISKFPEYNQAKLNSDLEKLFLSYEINTKKVAQKELLEIESEIKEAIKGAPVGNPLDIPITDYGEEFQREVRFKATQLEDSAKITYKAYYDDYIATAEEIRYNIYADDLEALKGILKGDSLGYIDEAIKASESIKLNSPTVIDDLVRKFTIDTTKYKFISDENTTYVLNSNNRKERLASWYERNQRRTITNQADEVTRQINASIGNDLIMTSAHSDSSKLCYPYQADIFSEFGNDKDYPLYQVALDGGYRHWGCRHFNSIYIKGYTPDPKETFEEDIASKKENEELYQKRQIGKYYRRQQKKNYEKYKKAKSVGEDKLASNFRQKQKQFKELADKTGVN